MAKKGPRLSIIPAVAVFDTRVGAAAFRVLAAFGVNADENGACWPSLNKLGAK